MAAKNSNSWADLWDSHNNVEDQSSSLSNGNGNKPQKSLKKKYSKKFEQSFNKTKEAASTGMDKTKDSVCSGMKKVKDGASGSVSWMKLKFSKSSSAK